MKYHLYYDPNTKTAQVLPEDDPEIPEGFDLIGEFVYDPDTPDKTPPLGPDNSHVLFHEIQELLYQVGVMDLDAVTILGQEEEEDFGVMKPLSFTINTALASNDVSYEVRGGGRYEVDWGDGTVETRFSPLTHSYAETGQYDVEVKVLDGVLGELYFTNKKEIIAVKDFGDTTIRPYFNLCSNLINLPDRLPKSIYDLEGALARTNISDLSPLSNWDTSNVTTLHAMFKQCKNITNVDALANWNINKVTDIGELFYNCENLVNVNGLSNWDTSNVVDMKRVFYNCENLSNIGGLYYWDTSNVTDMASTFERCSSLVDPSPLALWDVSNVLTMQYLFSYCSSLTNLNGLAAWNTSNVTNMERMFDNSGSFNDVSPLSNWDVGKVTNMKYIFYNVSSSLTGDLSNWCVKLISSRPTGFSSSSNLIEPIWGTCPGED